MDAGIQSHGCEAVIKILFFVSSARTYHKLPSMALDSGIHAGMTVTLGYV